MPLSSGALVETWGEQGMMAVIHGTERWRGSGREVLQGLRAETRSPSLQWRWQPGGGEGNGDKRLDRSWPSLSWTEETAGT